MIEIVTFSLVDGADVAAFLAADALVQTDFAYRQPGLARRTTARSEDGRWLVLTLWASANAADAGAIAATSDAAALAFAGFMDGSSVRIERFSPLD